jgi:hypothetical protein
MNTLLQRKEFLLAGVSRNSRWVEVLNRACGTAEHYWFSFFAVNFAEAVISNRVGTN